MREIYVACVLFLLLSGSIYGQYVVQGRVINANDGKGLAAAHVIIKDTYNGAIANEDGEFSLKTDHFPVTLTARFIGFKTTEVVLESPPETGILIEMPESVAQLEELVVTGEDPAVFVMKEVIRRKKVWRGTLNTYRAEAYSRQTLLNDTTVVSVSESLSEVYWDKTRGAREVLRSKRQTANIARDNNFAGVSYLPDFYDDELSIAGFDIIGITSEHAFRYYTFELLGLSSLDGRTVYHIQVIPKKNFQPLFEGEIYVLDEVFVLLSVSLTPNSVVVFRPPVQDFNLVYEQQFSSFGGDYWLPADIRIQGRVKVGLVGLQFPPIGFKQVSSVNRYIVNTPLPDSLFEQKSITEGEAARKEITDSLFTHQAEAVPLTKAEQEAYSGQDSTLTLEKAFRPEGFLVRFLDLDDDEHTGKSRSNPDVTKSAFLTTLNNTFTPIGRFNKTDALAAGVKAESSFLENRIKTGARVSYSFGYRAWNHGATLDVQPVRELGQFRTEAGYLYDTATTGRSGLYGMLLTGFMPLTGFDDYFDYYRNERLFINLKYKTPASGMVYTLGYAFEKHRSINFKTSYDLLGRNNVQPYNPPVDEGNYNIIRFALAAGDGFENNFGITGQNGLTITAEQSLSNPARRNYTRFEVDLYRSIPTFYQRRLFPNTLDFRVNAGTYLGDLPVQEYGMLDASLGFFTPFGAFKTKRFIPYRGAGYAGMYAEHNFRSVPFEALGWRSAPKTGLGLIVFGGAGKTWSPENPGNQFDVYGTRGIHFETGISVNNIFSLFRIDVAFRLDEPGFYPGISVSRIF